MGGEAHVDWHASSPSRHPYIAYLDCKSFQEKYMIVTVWIENQDEREMRLELVYICEWVGSGGRTEKRKQLDYYLKESWEDSGRLPANDK